MRKQTSLTIICAAVLVILLAVVGWQWWYGQQQRTEQAISSDFITAFTVADVIEIQLTQADTVTTLTRSTNGNDTVWVVSSADSAPANAAAITQLLDTVHNSSITATVATTVADLTTYGLDDATALSVVVKTANGTVADIRVGKVGALGQTFYAQRVNDEAVYLVTGQRTTIVRPQWTEATADGTE